MVIYTLTNTVNKKQYVGMTQETAQKRFRRHIQDARNGSKYAIHRAIRKYGKQGFVVESVDAATTKEKLKQKEIEWIAKLDTFGKGYNMTPGGDGGGHPGHKMSKQAKKKLSRTKLEYWNIHPEMKEQASARMKGNQYTLGQKRNSETKQKLATALLGNKNNLGNKRSRVTKNKMSESISRRLSKPHIFVGPDNSVTETLNLRQFCIEHGLNDSHMFSVASGKRNQHKGWRKWPILTIA